MSVKVAVVVGVVIAVLFAAVLAFGGGDGEGDAAAESENDSGIIGRLRDRAGDPASVELADVSGCFSDDEPTLLEFPGSCALQVTNDGEGIRVLRLRSDATGLNVQAPAPEGDTEIDADFDAGEEATVAVGEGTTEVRLSCGGPFTQCRVWVLV